MSVQFHQILVSASPGDAITSVAYELRDLLRQIGPSEIYAPYIHPELQNDVIELKYFRSRQSPQLSKDVIVFHASIGEPDVTRFVATRPEKLVVLYHNVSPPDRFLAFDPKFAGLLAAGRIEVESLADKAVAAITVSEYNATELRQAGYRNITVCPLIIDVNKMHSVTAHGPTLNHFEQGIDGPMVLFVGQLLPHKRPDFLVQAYHILVTYLIPEPALVMVGAPRLPAFSDHLEHLVNELNLDKAWLTGTVDDSRLAAFYRSADLFVTASEHEGFCAPVIEAMGFDVPVVARRTAAIPETVGDAAVLLEMNDGPAVMAEAMAEMIENKSLRRDLIEKGRARAAEFDPDRARAQLLNQVLQAVEQ